MKRNFKIVDDNHVSFMKFSAYEIKPREVKRLVTLDEMEYIKRIINDENLINDFCYRIA